jgi:hypothetical protein
MPAPLQDRSLHGSGLVCRQCSLQTLAVPLSERPAFAATLVPSFKRGAILGDAPRPARAAATTFDLSRMRPRITDDAPIPPAAKMDNTGRCALGRKWRRVFAVARSWQRPRVPTSCVSAPVDSLGQSRIYAYYGKRVWLSTLEADFIVRPYNSGPW